VADRLSETATMERAIPIGINIGKGRDTALEYALDDYLIALDHLLPYATYIVLNVSSPNTSQLRELQRIDYLRNILKSVVEKVKRFAEAQGEAPKMVFTKVSPDSSEDELQEMAHLALECGTGLIATNTTTDFSSLNQMPPWEGGGLSGRPLKNKSNHAIRILRKATRGSVPIIGVGGIFSAEDAYEKIQLGASLVQVYTGWIYEGPALIPAINKGLLKLLDRDGFKTIHDAVGTLE
jgi:dihydroorotate dehydrogenase